VLDVGPYSKSQSDDKPVKGDVYSVPYIYSSGDKANGNATTALSGSIATSPAETTPANSVPREATVTSSGEMVEVTDGFAYATVGEPQVLDDMVVRL
ncbi:hypothetical protein ElyMa_001768400, partial [Elysia marginata]